MGCAKLCAFGGVLRKGLVNEQSSQASVGRGGVSFIQLQPPAERTRHPIPAVTSETPYQGRRSGPPTLTRCREKKPLPSAQRIEKTTPRRGLFRFWCFVWWLSGEGIPLAELAVSLVSPCWASHFFLCGQEKVTKKKATPYIRVLLRKTSLPPAMLRGSSRRDIHVPSLLARHPCLASPCATPTLGLLKGSGPSCLKVCKKPKSQRAKLASLLESEPSDGTERPFQEAEWNPRGGERAAWMPREA